MVTCPDGHPSPPRATRATSAAPGCRRSGTSNHRHPGNRGSPGRPYSRRQAAPGRRLAALSYPPPPGQPWVALTGVPCIEARAGASPGCRRAWTSNHRHRGYRGSPGRPSSLGIQLPRAAGELGHPTTATRASVGPHDCPMHIRGKGGVAP